MFQISKLPGFTNVLNIIKLDPSTGKLPTLHNAAREIQGEFNHLPVTFFILRTKDDPLNPFQIIITLAQDVLNLYQDYSTKKTLRQPLQISHSRYTKLNFFLEFSNLSSKYGVDLLNLELFYISNSILTPVQAETNLETREPYLILEEQDGHPRFVPLPLLHQILSNHISQQFSKLVKWVKWRIITYSNSTKSPTSRI